MMNSFVKVEQEAGCFGCVDPAGRAKRRIVDGLGNRISQRASDHLPVGSPETHPVAALGNLRRHVAARNITQEAFAVAVTDLVSVGQRKQKLNEGAIEVWD